MSLHTSSSSTSSAEGSAFPWILEHLLAYPGSYEIPLRTMYTLNSTPHAQPFPRQSGRPDTPSLCSSNGSSPDSTPASPTFPPEQQQQLVAQSATEHFKSCLMSHISNLPTQPFSLPPSFITSFVRRCFTADLCLVDFTQALTALDYLKDLESRRKRELNMALQRLGVDKERINETGEDVMKRYPRVSEWIKSMEDKERKVEALYTQVYIGLRRWTLINEMRLEPFSKPNSIAMLNTLYPPTATAPPTRQLTSTILTSQRQAFFRYIQGVEKNGKSILKNLEHQGERPTDANGWAVVREVVDKYLRAANGIIEECIEITGTDTFDPRSDEYRRNERRTDSGISFATTDRPSTSSTNSSRNNSIQTSNTSRTNSMDKTKPLPDCPNAYPLGARPDSPLTLKKRGTTLEKIAREIRNLRTRNDVRELDHRHIYDTARTQDPSSKSKSLKKMKSTSSIGGARAKHSRSGSSNSTFEIDDERRERLLQEARREKEIREKEKENREPPLKAAKILGQNLER